MTRRFKITAVALGCAQNRIDTEEILALLGRCGYPITDDPLQADLIIVNTCAFIEAAQQESIETILELAGERRGRRAPIIVAGCLAQRYGGRLLREIPEISGVIGVHSYPLIEPFIERALAGQRGLLLLPPPRRYRSLGARLPITAAHSAHVKIAEGCDNCCRYCLIPSLRGPLRSRPPGEIVAEIRELISRGAREINIVAQESTAYGLDRGIRGGLAKLLQKILREIDADFWLRILYANPARVDRALIDLIAREGRICKYLDLPLQHINDTLLKRMGRHYSGAAVSDLLQRLRQRIPDLVLRTTLMVGFPGESRARYRELSAFLHRWPIERVGVFSYSPQPGTAAARFPGQIPPRIKEKRRRDLLIMQQGPALEFNRSLLGKKFAVLVEGPVGESGSFFRGRTSFQAPEVDGALYFRSSRPLEAGDLVRVRITAVSPYDLYGTPLP